MKVEELRIGNYVLDNLGGTLKIKSISLDSTLSHLKPIPLTEEWLLKFGFETKHSLTDVHYCKFLQDEYDFTFCLSRKNGYSVFYINYKNDYDESCFVLQVKYVHQLQNLYFALTGEELTIK